MTRKIGDYLNICKSHSKLIHSSQKIFLNKCRGRNIPSSSNSRGESQERRFQGLVTGKDKEKMMIVNDMTNIEEIQRLSNPISNQPIPISSIYYRLFENIENHKVPSYTIPPYQQISKLSPQTPLNKRRCILGKSFI